MSKVESAAEWVLLSSLKRWPGNPRNNAAAVAEVAKSIKRFGFGAPMIANRADRMLIGGDTRYQAAELLALDKVPVRFLDLPHAEARALALADNKLGEIATWDDAALADVLREIGAADETLLAETGFSDAELAALLGETVEPVPEPEGGAPAIDESKPPVSQFGEMFELGSHRLVCGDVRDKSTIAQLLIVMGKKRVHCAVTSPPYASQRTYDAEGSDFKPIPPDEYCDWFDAVQANVRALLAPDGSFLLNIKEHCEDGSRHLYVKDLTIAHVRKWGWRFVDEYVWIHGGTPRAVVNRFKNGWEPIFHFTLAESFKFRPESVRKVSGDAEKWAIQKYDGAHPADEDKQGVNAADLKRKLIKEGRGTAAKMQGSLRGGAAIRAAVQDATAGESLAYPSNVISPGKNREALGHAAAYPVGLAEFFIQAYSDVGDLVFDPFMGSGSTLIAAAIHGRAAVGVELSPLYCDIIRRRWTRWAIANGQKPGSGALDG